MSSEEVCEALESLEFSRLAISDDMVELLTSVLPTHEESLKLKSHQNSPELLRDIEQKVLPFCFLQRATARLRLFRLAASHAENSRAYLRRCQTLSLAAMEAKSSLELRKVLAMILQIANYINHGKDFGGGAHAFSIETLAAITSFRLGSMSTLQFLCVTLRRANPTFLESLSGSLMNVPAAAREKSVHLKSCVQSFLKEVEFAEREVLHLPEDQPASEAMATLLKDLQAEAADLTDSLAAAFDKCEEVQEYFCTSEEKQKDTTPPYELFFSYLSDFLDSLRKAWKETQPASQQNRPPATQRPRRRRDSEKPRADTSTTRVSLTTCRRAFPDESVPGTRRNSGGIVSSTQSEPSLETVGTGAEKHGKFWEMDMDVEALLSDIFAPHEDNDKGSRCPPHAPNAEVEPRPSVTEEPFNAGQQTQASEVQIDVDDLIDSIFD